MPVSSNYKYILTSNLFNHAYLINIKVLYKSAMTELYYERDFSIMSYVKKINLTDF